MGLGVGGVYLGEGGVYLGEGHRLGVGVGLGEDREWER